MLKRNIYVGQGAEEGSIFFCSRPAGGRTQRSQRGELFLGGRCVYEFFLNKSGVCRLYVFLPRVRTATRVCQRDRRGPGERRDRDWIEN